MTILYKEFVKNLKHTFEMVGEETVQVPAKIDINDVAFSVSFMNKGYVPSFEDTIAPQDCVVISFTSFLVNDVMKTHSMSEIIAMAEDLIVDMDKEIKDSIVGFLTYCQAGLCFYEPLTIRKDGE